MSDEKELKGLGGWLILVGIGVVLGPIRLLAVFLPLYFPMFSDGTWAALTTPSSEVYTPYFGTMLIAEMCFNSLMLLACLFLVFLFFTKKPSLPKGLYRHHCRIVDFYSARRLGGNSSVPRPINV